MRQRKLIFALLVILPILAGCKSESPTAPPPTTGGAPTGGVTPPVGASITLTVSNASPVVNSTSTITATVTVNNQAVPNGTAVEYSTNLGTFTDTGTNTTVKITNGGTASAILTSGTAGTATVIVTVNNSNKSTTITFGASGNPTPGGPPTITSVTPNFGLPTGGQQVTINGTNFQRPVRVLFDPGSGQAAKEGFVVSSTSTQIVVVTPAFDLGTGQTLPVTVTVITQAGTTSEQSVSLPAAFTFQLAVLTPSIRAVQPTSGPISGGTRVTIFGDAFQPPLIQVFFGAAEAQVISSNFSQLVVMSPRASDTAPGGSGPITGPVNVRVVNVASGKEATLSGGFRYIPKMVITAFAPGVGTALGGTKVTIDGSGFADPVAVTIGDFATQPIRVSGTEIVVQTLSTGTPCNPATGPIKVTNIENGDSATTSGNFSFLPVKPVITSVAPSPVVPGTSITVSVQNPGIGPLGSANIRFTINGKTVIPTPSLIVVGTGVQDFTVVVPPANTFTFPPVPCGSGGMNLGPVTTSLVFNNITTGCSDSIDITIQPNPLTNPCPPPTATVTSPAPSCPVPNLSPPIVSIATPPTTQTATITITNATNSQTLTLGAPVISNTGTATETATITPTTGANVNGGSSVSYTVTVTPTTAGTTGATITFTSNDPTKPNIVVNVCGTATP